MSKKLVHQLENGRFEIENGEGFGIELNRRQTREVYEDLDSYFRIPNSVTIPTAEYERLKADVLGQASLIEKLRDALKDTDTRLANHHDMNHIHAQRLGVACSLCTKEPSVFVRNDEILQLVTAAKKSGVA